MKASADIQSMSTHQLLAQAQKLNTLLESGAVSVPYRAELAAANNEFIGLLEKSPDMTLKSFTDSLADSSKTNAARSQLFKNISWTSFAAVVASMLFGPLLPGEGPLIASLVQMGGAFGYFGGMGFQVRANDRIKANDKLANQVEDWASALQKPALNGAPLGQLAEGLSS